MFISRGEATGGGKLRQLFLELEMNRMGGEGHSFRSGMAEGVRRLRGRPREA